MECCPAGRSGARWSGVPPDEKADYGHDNSTPVLQTPYYCAVCNEHMGDVRSPDDVPLRKWAVCYSCQKRATPAPQQAEAVPVAWRARDANGRWMYGDLPTPDLPAGEPELLALAGVGSLSEHYPKAQ